MNRPVKWLLWAGFLSIAVCIADVCFAATLDVPTGNCLAAPYTITVSGLTMDANNKLCIGAHYNGGSGYPGGHQCDTGETGDASSGSCNLNVTNDNEIVSIFAFSTNDPDCADGVFSGNTFEAITELSITTAASCEEEEEETATSTETYASEATLDAVAMGIATLEFATGFALGYWLRRRTLTH